MEAAAREGDETWVTFDVDEDEALSLSDLPILDRSEGEGDGGSGLGGEEPTTECPQQEAEDFEFRTCGGAGGMRLEAGGDGDMCAADEVFFQGQILPLRSSVSSDGGLFPASRCGSRSESMDRYSAAGSLGFESSRSLSGRSSTSISRSQSTHSSNSASSGGRLSVSNNFYAHPSPKPHLCPRRRQSSCSLARKSTGSAWGLLRLGLVKTPAIDFDGLKLRKASAALGTSALTVTDRRRSVGNEDGGRPPERTKAAPIPCNAHRTDGASGKFDDARSSRDEGKLPEKKASRSTTLANRLRCSCSPGDVVEVTCSRAAVPGDVPGRERAAHQRGSSSLRRRQDGWCHSRTFQWLADLPVPKGDGGALGR